MQRLLLLVGCRIGNQLNGKERETYLILAINHEVVPIAIKGDETCPINEKDKHGLKTSVDWSKLIIIGINFEDLKWVSI